MAQPSIKDVALRSGVSYKTVSRVVNGEPNVRVATRLRVEAAVAALGYRPDHAARSLRRGRTQTLRLLLVRSRDRFLTEPFPDQVVAGVVDRAARDGYALLLEVASPDDTALAAPGAAERRVDGTILLDSRSASPLLPSLTPALLPCVVLPTCPTVPGVGWVYADFRGGAARLVAHLVALGHRRIAHLAGVPSPTEQDRLAGYEDGLAAAGIVRDEALIMPTGNQRHLGDAAMERLLAEVADVTAVVAVNDATALGAIDCLRRLGRRVPAEVSLVGFDDVELAAWSSPPLTTMRLPAYEMGVAAVELVVDALAGGQAATVGRDLPVELVVRGSTAPPPSVR